MSHAIKAGCTGKKQFVSFIDARRAAKRRNQNTDGARLEPYHCPRCGFCHVGEARDAGHRDRRKEMRDAD